jgi:ABC-type uncharacterized transport system substrate-binding protein
MADHWGAGMIRMAGAALLLGGLVAATGPALAHPHIFITATATALFAGDRITGLRIEWLFDDVFSDTVIQDHDADHDGRFDAKEIADIAANAFAAVKDFHYFTYVWVDGKMVEPLRVRDFTASQDKGLVTYGFVVPLPAPVDPRVARVQAELYDETYYVQVDLAETRPVRFAGGGAACQGRIARDGKRRYYGGVMVPLQITVACGG